MIVKGEHERRFAYEAHTACDKHGMVLEVEAPGDVHDSIPEASRRTALSCGPTHATMRRRGAVCGTRT